MSWPGFSFEKPNLTTVLWLTFNLQVERVGNVSGTGWTIPLTTQLHFETWDAGACSATWSWTRSHTRSRFPLELPLNNAVHQLLGACQSFCFIPKLIQVRPPSGCSVLVCQFSDWCHVIRPSNLCNVKKPRENEQLMMSWNVFIPALGQTKKNQLWALTSSLWCVSCGGQWKKNYVTHKNIYYCYLFSAFSYLNRMWRDNKQCVDRMKNLTHGWEVHL